MEELKKQLGKKIREVREEKGLTQKELGKTPGYSPIVISHFERGIRDLKISNLQKLSKILDKRLSYFLPSSTTFFRTQPPYSPKVTKSLKEFDKFISKQEKKK